MKLDRLPKIITRPKKRIGRGLGSGKGKTGGRGYKGQKSRGKISSDFSGGGAPLYKKIPFLRGARNPKISKKPVLLSLEALNKLKANSIVDLETLIKENLVLAKDVSRVGIKILNKGEISKALTIKLPISKGAKEKIEKAGGKIV